MARLIIVITLIFIVSTPLIAEATQTGITKDLIVEKNAKMQSLLQKRDPQLTMNFLHSHISDNATFEISFENNTMPKEIKKNSLKMDKAAYINSFIFGQNYIDNYNVKIKTQNVEIVENGKTAIVEEIMTEEGVMLNPNNILDEGIPFLSVTTCKTTYGFKAGVVQSDKASCNTKTGELATI